MTNAQALKGWGWAFAALMAGALLLPLLGCDSPARSSPGIVYSAPADFSKGLGEVKFFQGEGGKVVYWEVTYVNDTNGPRFLSVSPAINFKDDTGKIIWTGRDYKRWLALPGAKGVEGGKIEIPEWVLRPTWKFEQAGSAGSEISGEASTK